MIKDVCFSEEWLDQFKKKTDQFWFNFRKMFAEIGEQLNFEEIVY